MADEKPELTPEAMQALAQKALELNMLQCKSELEAVLKKYGCAMRVGAPTIEVVKLPTTPEPTKLDPAKPEPPAT